MLAPVSAEYEPLEYAHIMLKPEAVMMLQRGIKYDLLGKIIALAKSASVLTSDWVFLTLTRDEVELIYAREIENGAISGLRLDTMAQWPSAHLILAGQHAKMISTVIKGRVSCRGGATCYVDYLPPGKNLLLPVITEECPENEMEVKSWSFGCGVRRDLSKLGVIVPEDGRGNDTTWNMLHSTATKDMYVDAFVYRLNAMQNDRFMTFEELPVIPDFRTI